MCKKHAGIFCNAAHSVSRTTYYVNRFCLLNRLLKNYSGTIAEIISNLECVYYHLLFGKKRKKVEEFLIYDDSV